LRRQREAGRRHDGGRHCAVTYDAINRLTKEEVDVSTAGEDYTKD
jgi:hypothetical protein